MLEYLLFNDFELIVDNDFFVDVIRDLVIGKIDELDFVDLFYF